MVDKFKVSKNLTSSIQKMFQDWEVGIKEITKNKNRGVYKIVATDDNVLGLISVKDLADKFEELLSSQNVAECVLEKLGGVGCSSFITSKALPLIYTSKSIKKYVKDNFFCFVSEMQYWDIVLIEGEEYFVYYDYYCIDSEMAKLIYVD